jgi:hypothetical protein
MDVHVRRDVTNGLRLRGVDVLRAQDDGDSARLQDADLLDRATSLGRVLFSQDDDLLIEAARRQAAGVRFSGVVFAHQLSIGVGQCISDLELVATATDPDQCVGLVIYLPI